MKGSYGIKKLYGGAGRGYGGGGRICHFLLVKSVTFLIGSFFLILIVKI